MKCVYILIKYLHRSNNPLLFSECQQLVDFSCVIHLLHGDVSIQSKNVEKETKIHAPYLSGHGCVSNFQLCVPCIFNALVQVCLELSCSLCIGLLIPLPGVIATLTMEDYGYFIVSIPPLFCGPLNGDLVFYSMILLINIILVMGIPMLIIVTWLLHKV